MYSFYNIREIRPEGWLKQQLKLEADGLVGHLDKVWPDIADSGWIGGGHESWERVPYWLDGFLPLAYLLEDEDLIKRANSYMEAILDRQQEDGWICPCEKEQRGEYDIWALMLIAKVLVQYCELTGSERAKKGLVRALKNAYGLMKDGTVKLIVWGVYRWYEAVPAMKYAYDLCGEEWLKDLALLFEAQGAQYIDYLDRWERPLNRWTFETHIVNIGMMLKYEAVLADFLGRPMEDKAETMWKQLEKYNGTAAGIFTGDECLSGKLNNQGSELCSVMELMYSCELLYQITGKAVWMDRLEKIAFNALPATISDDMWTHQYDQMANQIACQRFFNRSQFRTNGAEAHLFGLEPNYGCCTANMAQGWPKLAASVFKKEKDGVTVAMMLPAELKTTVKGAHVTVKIETEYPFRMTGRITVSTDRPVSMKLRVRVPAWSKETTLNGEKKRGGITVSKCFTGTETFRVSFADVPKMTARPFNMKAVTYGPLTFALPIEAEWKMFEFEKNGVVRKFPYCDYELIPQSEWRWGLTDGKMTVEELPGDEIPFSSKNPRLAIRVQAARADWDYETGFDTVSAVTPRSRKAQSVPEEKQLIPYGCAKLRVTELPFLK